MERNKAEKRAEKIVGSNRKSYPSLEKAIADALQQAAAEAREPLQAEVEVLRGVYCCSDGDGPCGVCLKCAYERGRRDGYSEAVRLAVVEGLGEPGCLEGYCQITGKASGMHTNGGCHCLGEVKPIRLKHWFMKALRARLADEPPATEGDET